MRILSFILSQPVATISILLISMICIVCGDPCDCFDLEILRSSSPDQSCITLHIDTSDDHIHDEQCNNTDLRSLLVPICKDTGSLSPTNIQENLGHLHLPSSHSFTSSFVILSKKQMGLEIQFHDHQPPQSLTFCSDEVLSFSTVYSSDDIYVNDHHCPHIQDIRGHFCIPSLVLSIFPSFVLGH